MIQKRKPLLKKIIVLVYVFFLLFFLGTGVNRVSRCTDREVATLSAAQLENIIAVDMTASLSEDGKTMVLTPTGENPHVAFMCAAQGSDTVILTFSEPTLSGEFTLYSSVNGSYTENSIAPGIIHQEGYACYFRVTNDDWQHFRIRSTAPLAVSSITFSSTETATGFAPNFVSVALFLLTACLGVFAHSKWKLFDPLIEFFKKEKFLCKELIAQNKAAFVLHLLAYACAALYLLMAFADLAFAFVSVAFGKAEFFVALLAAVFFFVDRAWIRKDAHPAVLFLGFMVLVGSAAALALPAGTVTSWDDEYHFAYAAYPSALLAGKPMSLADLMVQFQQFSAKTFGENPEKHLALLLHDAQIYGCSISFFLPIDSLMQTVSHLPAASYLAAPVVLIYYAFIYMVYFPCAATFWLCRAVGTDYFTMITLGKLANFALYTAVCYLGIRHLRRGGAIFAGVALIPSSFFIATNFTCDAWVTSFILAGTALFVSVFQSEEPPSRAKLAAMIALVAIGCGPKAIYFFMLFPFLFLPRRCFKSKKGAWCFRVAVVLVALAVFLSFALPFLINTDSKTDLRGGSDVNAAEQILYILKNPFVYAKTLFNFLAGYVAFPNFASYVSFMGYIGNAKPFVSSLYILLLFFAAFTGKGKGDRSLGYGRLRAVSLVTVLITLMLVASSLYVGFTPVGANTVFGCQFRYIFPLLPLFLYALPSAQIDNCAKEHRYHFFTVGGMALLCAYCFYKIYFIQFLGA